MSDAILTAEYLEQVASSIEDALMDRGIGQRTVQVAVCSSDAKTMQEAAALLRGIEVQLSAARREAAEAQAREQWHIQKADELHELLIKEPNVKGALDLTEHYLRMMRSAPISDAALAAAIEQAVAPYREDAERYRWLKAQNETDDGFCVCDGTLEIIGTHPGSLDAALDAARKGGV